MTPLPTNWTDGYGTVHAGQPPEGYWIASDDRWYAPELHPAYVPVPADPVSTMPDVGQAEEPAPTIGAFDAVDRTQAEPEAAAWQMPALDDIPSAPPPEQPVAPDPQPRDADAPTPNSRIVVTALVGVLAIFGLAAAGYLLMNQGDDTSSIISGGDAGGSNRTPTLPAEITVPVDGTTTPGDDDLTPSSEADAAEAPPTTLGGAARPGGVQPAASDDRGLEGIESCARIDSDTLEITMVNVTEATASYLLTVVYLDDAGTRVGDDNVYVSSLRPGERTVEQSYVFSDAGVDCEVIDADRYDRNGVDGIADISACTIREPNSYGFIEADLTATNSGPSDVDYTVEVALVDADNVRRGYGTAYIERTPVGASAPGEVYTTVEYDETLRCDVVAVTRFESTQ